MAEFAEAQFTKQQKDFMLELLNKHQISGPREQVRLHLQLVDGCIQALIAEKKQAKQPEVK